MYTVKISENIIMKLFLPDIWCKHIDFALKSLVGKLKLNLMVHYFCHWQNYYAAVSIKFTFRTCFDSQKY